MKLTNFRLTDTTTELYELKTELPTESYNFMIKKWNWPKQRCVFLEPKTGKDVIMSEREREVGASRLLSRFFNVNVVFGVWSNCWRNPQPQMTTCFPPQSLKPKKHTKRAKMRHVSMAPAQEWHAIRLCLVVWKRYIHSRCIQAQFVQFV